MTVLMLAVALVAAAVMATGVALVVRTTVPVSLPAGLAAGAAACGVSAALAALLPASVPGGTGAAIAAAIASGAAPIAVLLLALFGREDRARLAPVLAVGLWAVVVVPLAIVVPQAIVSGCAPETCVVEDFGGGLPFAIGVGAFIIVPSAAMPTLRRPAVARGTHRSDALILLVWAAYILWTVSLEMDVDPFTPRIALVAILAPASGAIGWALTDRIRGLDASVTRGLGLGLVAGMVAMLPAAVAVTPWWALLVGAIGGIAGALAHDARALQGAPPTARVAVAALVVGVIGMLAPGILGTLLGFVFAARVDVLGSQLIAIIGVAVVALVLSIPAAVVLRRRAGR